ncbi:hypothetical protein [Bradyrhizobium zhanjiangense]
MGTTEQAARPANAHEFILRLGKGYGKPLVSAASSYAAVSGRALRWRAPF